MKIIFFYVVSCFKINQLSHILFFLNLNHRFVKPEVIEKYSTPNMLVSLDIDKTEMYLPVEKVDVGFVVKKNN